MRGETRIGDASLIEGLLDAAGRTQWPEGRDDAVLLLGTALALCSSLLQAESVDSWESNVLDFDMRTLLIRLWSTSIRLDVERWMDASVGVQSRRVEDFSDTVLYILLLKCRAEADVGRLSEMILPDTFRSMENKDMAKLIAEDAFAAMKASSSFARAKYLVLSCIEEITKASSVANQQFHISATGSVLLL